MILWSMQNPGQTRLFYKPDETPFTWKKYEPDDLWPNPISTLMLIIIIFKHLCYFLDITNVIYVYKCDHMHQDMW